MADSLALVEPYLPEIAQGAAMYASAHGTKPEEVAFICAIGLRESLMGTVLRPKGLDGSGDWSVRRGKWCRASGVEVFPDTDGSRAALRTAGWSIPKDAHGQVLPGPYAIPHDGKGWGRGVFQFDVCGDVRDLIAPEPWPMDRQAAACCAMLAICRRDLAGHEGHPLYERAVASRYNAAASAVLAGIDAGDPDLSTTGGDYGKDVLRRRDALLAKYPDRLRREVA